MKKFLSIILMVAFGASISFAQQGDFRFGFQVSPTFSWMTTNQTYINPNGNIPGIKLGAIGEYYFRNEYAFFGGLGFGFNTGGRLRHDFSGTYWDETEKGIGIDTLSAGVNLKYNLQYVEIPFGLKMKTKEFGYLRYFAEIPRFTLGFESQARGTISDNNQAGKESTIEDLNIASEINGLILSWGFGGGVEYNVSPSTALVGGIFFQNSFTDVTDDNGITIHDTRGDIKNDEKTSIRQIVVRIGVLF